MQLRLPYYNAVVLVQDATSSQDDVDAATDLLNARVAVYPDDVAAAAAVSEMIEALPSVDDLTLDDKADVEAAKAAYEALTSCQKTLVSDELTAKLDALVQRLAELKAEEPGTSTTTGSTTGTIGTTGTTTSTTANSKTGVETSNVALPIAAVICLCAAAIVYTKKIKR